MKNDSRMRIWEAALLISLCISLCWGIRAAAAQERLSEGIIRMHVVAADDSAEEQALKLRVQSAVKSLVEPALRGCASPGQARAKINAMLPEIEKTARENAQGRRVSVSFGRKSYGVRRCESCVLPAGVYNSLRVEIGGGRGHNWWGVIFPALTPSEPGCMDAASILGGDNLRLISGGDGVELRFRLLELFQELREMAGW